jgi:prevent-host-death family protein
MATATIFEAKTNLSELVKRALQGEDIIITSGREKKPVARLVPVEPVIQRRLGAWLTPGFEIGEAFWEPMSDEECGHGGDDLL